MGVGKKMCKYKEFKIAGLMGHLNGKQTIICNNPNITKRESERNNKDPKYCSRRLCSHYESR